MVCKLLIENLLFTIPFVGEDTSFDSDSLTVARGEDTFIRHVDELILERGAACIDDEYIVHSKSLLTHVL